MKLQVKVYVDKNYQKCVYEEAVEARTFSPTIAKWAAATTVEVWDTEANEDGEITESTMAATNGTAYVEVCHRDSVYRVVVDCFNEPHYFAREVEKQQAQRLQ